MLKYLIFGLLFVNFTSAQRFEEEVPNYLRQLNEEIEQFDDEDHRINYRLNDDTWPSYYKLHINAFYDPQEKYSGEVDITFRAAVATNDIVLNQQGITLLDSKLFELNDDRLQPIDTGCVTNNTYEKIVCTLPEGTIQAGRVYQINFKYEGTVHKDMRGFYQSYYKKNDGSIKTLGTTHFGQQARRLLPCWDEPRFKAQFEISVTRNNTIYTSSVTNGELIKSEADEVHPEIVTDFHATTSRIPAYILALVVSDYEARKSDSPKYSIYARPNAIEQTKFVYDILPKLVVGFDFWTKLHYYDFESVTKIDMAAIPDFSAGAMENWGLLIHREVSMLADPDYRGKPTYTTTAQYQSIARTTSHEVAHQWFGDLVTCDWWEATWINEGFANYFADIGLDWVYPNWEIMSQYVVDTFQNALLADGSPGATPMTNPGLYNYADIRTMFTTISYDKAGSILRMMDNLMGAKFQAGIRQYLVENSYKTAKPEDLFRVLQEQIPEMPIVEIMTRYSEQSGYPLITAKREGGKLTLTQKRFLTETTETDDRKWIVPITVATNRDEMTDTLSRLTLFSYNQNSIEITIPADAEFYVINVGSFNYHRVNYDEQNWRAIKKALEMKDFGGIPKTNRAQIIDDLFNLARSGHLKYDFVFDILHNYLKHEWEYEPWYSTFSGLNYLQIRIPNEEYRREFSAFIRDITGPIYNLGSSVGHGVHTVKLHWLRVLDWSCKFGLPECLDFAMEEFDKVAKNKEIAADNKPTVFCNGLRHSANQWSFLWRKYTSTNYATEQAIIVTALGCTKDAEELGNFLQAILSEDIRPQDKSAAYNRAYTGNLENIDIVLDWIIKNYELWQTKMNLGATLSDLASRFTREDQVTKLEKFRDETSSLSDGTKATLTNAIARANRNIEWDRTRLPEMMTFFERIRPTDGSATMQTYLSIGVLILSILAIRVFN